MFEIAWKYFIPLKGQNNEVFFIWKGGCNWFYLKLAYDRQKDIVFLLYRFIKLQLSNFIEWNNSESKHLLHLMPNWSFNSLLHDFTWNNRNFTYDALKKT